MNDEAKPTDQKTAKAKASGLVKGVILHDDCFSSKGRHMKGEKVELPEEDVAALEKNGFITRA